MSANCITVIQPCVRIEKAEWLARRSELQNKPSWADFRECAKFMAQDSDGAWRAFEIEPTPQSLIWNAKRGWRGYAYKDTPYNRGEVLGDWRDTLEKRPQAEADITDPFDPEFRSVTVSNETIPLEHPVVVASIGDAIQGKCPSCGNTGIHACLGRKVTHTDTANEITKWVAKQQAKETSDWHERGGLPPVGAVCLYVISDRLSAEVEITAHAKFGLCFVEVGKSGENYVSKTAELHRFRPIRTERDKAIDEMKQHCPHHGSWDTVGRIYAEALYDAGYRK